MYMDPASTESLFSTSMSAYSSARAVKQLFDKTRSYPARMVREFTGTQVFLDTRKLIVIVIAIGNYVYNYGSQFEWLFKAIVGKIVTGALYNLFCDDARPKDAAHERKVAEVHAMLWSGFIAVSVRMFDINKVLDFIQNGEYGEQKNFYRGAWDAVRDNLWSAGGLWSTFFGNLGANNAGYADMIFTYFKQTDYKNIFDVTLFLVYLGLTSFEILKDIADEIIWKVARCMVYASKKGGKRYTRKKK